MNAEKTELTFNIFLPFIPSVGSVSGIAVDGEGCNIELFVTVMFCCAGCAWACGAALLLGVAKAASSGFTIFYLRFVSSLLFLISHPRRQSNDRVRRRKTSTRVHSQI